MAGYQENQLKPGEVTSQMLAEARGITVYQARDLLARAVRDGKMTCRDIFTRGHNIKAYRRVE